MDIPSFGRLIVGRMVVKPRMMSILSAFKLECGSRVWQITGPSLNKESYEPDQTDI